MKRSLEEISLSKGEYGGGFSAVEYFDGAPRYIRITDITEDGRLNKSVKAPSGDIKEWAKYKLKEGDILFARSGATVGKTFLFDESYGDCIYAGYLIRFRPDFEICFPKYVYYYTKTPEYFSWVETKQNVVAQPNINAKQYGSELHIPLPPLPQQKKIAAILDAADELRQNDKALVAKYDELTQALFLDMFGDPVSNPKGWEIVKLSQLSDITSSRRIFKDEYVEYGIPFYRTKEIVELSKNKKITSELFISNERYDDILKNNDIPIVGDILMSAVGTIGVMWVVNTSEPFYFKDGNLVWLKISKSKNINSKYLMMTLEYLIEHEKGNLAQGAAYNALTIDKLKKFEVNIAPISLQNQFAERVALIEEQKAIAQKSLDKSEELFNSLLQKAFKGELI